MGAVAFIVALVVLLFASARLGLFGGSTPAGLGVTEGRLKAPSRTPNSVSSQAGLWPDMPGREQASILPLSLALAGDGPATIARLAGLVEATAGARIVERRADYLYAQFSSKWLRFVDDVEFWFDPAAGVVQVRSASRVGRKDFGVNRARIEALRERLTAAT